MHPRNLLILIGVDPRESPRAAEAVRIGAGIGAWQKVRVSLYFHGAAVACLTEYPEDLEGGHLLQQYLPAILEHGGGIFVEHGNLLLADRQADLARTELSTDALRAMLQRFDYSINFGAVLPGLEAPVRLPATGADYDNLLDRIISDEVVHLW